MLAVLRPCSNWRHYHVTWHALVSLHRPDPLGAPLSLCTDHPSILDIATQADCHDCCEAPGLIMIIYAVPLPVNMAHDHGDYRWLLQRRLSPVLICEAPKRGEKVETASRSALTTSHTRSASASPGRGFAPLMRIFIRALFCNVLC